MSKELLRYKLYKYLYTNRNNKYFNSDMPNNHMHLYSDLIKASSDVEVTKFNNIIYSNLIIEIAYKYHALHGIENIANNDTYQLPYNIDRNLPYEEFRKQFIKYNEYPLATGVYDNDTYFNFACRSILNKVLLSDPWHGFTHFYSDKIEDKPKPKHDTKIYVCPENKALHLIAYILMDACNELGINYHFKINADDTYTRSDNLVIYTSNEDLPYYILLLEGIKEQNPEIKFYQEHLLSYPYNDFINLAPIDPPGHKESHSSNLCLQIVKLREESHTFEEFYNKVCNLLDDSLKDIEALSCRLEDLIRLEQYKL